MTDRRAALDQERQNRRGNVNPHRAGAPGALAKMPQLCIIRGMRTPLSDLRRAAPRRLTLQEIARKIRCSGPTLSNFETGKDLLSDELLARYARAIGASEVEVRKAFLLAAASYHARKLQEAQAALMGSISVRRPTRKRSLATA